MPLMFDDLPQPEGNKRLMFDDLPAPSVGQDIAKTIPSAAVRGVTSGLGLFGDLQAKPELAPSAPGTFTSYLEKARNFLEPPQLPTSATLRGAAEKVTGSLYEPQTTPGRYAGAVTESLANPVSYLGPGSVPLKLGGAVLSGAGGQAGEDVAGTPGRIAGAVLGGGVAGRMLGPAVEKAAIPTSAELKTAGKLGYTQAINSGLEVDPSSVGRFAAQARQDLQDLGHTGGPNGTATKAFATLDSLENAPAGTVGVTAANLDAIRKNLGIQAKETQANPNNVITPTSNAEAAGHILRNFKGYVENIPAADVRAGDPAAYANSIRQANADYAARFRTAAFENKLANAQEAYHGQTAGSLSSTIKAQTRPFLKAGSPAQQGFMPDEIAAVRGVNRGTIISNTLSQLGRGGAGVIPLTVQALSAIPAAYLTGGTSLLAQLPLAAGLYGARKAGEALTQKQMQGVIEMLAKRSPEYERRAALVAPANKAPQRAAIARALLTAY